MDSCGLCVIVKQRHSWKRTTCCPNRNHNFARASQWWGTKNPREIYNTAPGEILRVGLMGRGWRCRPRVAPSPQSANTPGQPPSGALYTRTHTRPLGDFFLWMQAYRVYKTSCAMEPKRLISLILYHKATQSHSLTDSPLQIVRHSPVMYPHKKYSPCSHI